jgi:hypothetical protein
VDVNLTCNDRVESAREIGFNGQRFLIASWPSRELLHRSPVTDLPAVQIGRRMRPVTRTLLSIVKRFQQPNELLRELIAMVHEDRRRNPPGFDCDNGMIASARRTQTNET